MREMQPRWRKNWWKKRWRKTGLWRFCSCQVIAVLVNLLCRWPHISAPYSQHSTIRTHFFTCQLLLQPQNTFFLCVNGNAKVHDLCTVLIRQHDWSTLTWKTEKPRGLHNTTLHLLCTTSMCSCMSYDDVRWFLVRGEAVVGLECWGGGAERSSVH